MTNEELLQAIALHGSVAKTAIALGISRQAISQRFTLLSEDNPLRKEYEALKGQRGRPASEIPADERNREAVRRHRAKKKNNDRLV